MDIKESIQKMISDELDRRSNMAQLVPLSTFCKTHKISRVTIWRLEKEGNINLTRIGKRIFLDQNQFVNKYSRRNEAAIK